MMIEAGTPSAAISNGIKLRMIASRWLLLAFVRIATFMIAN